MTNFEQRGNAQALGLSEATRTRLQELSGARPMVSWLQSDEKGPWSDAPDLSRVIKHNPMFITTSWRAPDPDNADHMMHLSDGVWVDLDVKDKSQPIDAAVRDLGLTVQKLEALGIRLQCCSLFASGGKGFHVFIPLALLIQGGLTNVGPLTARHWPRVCKEFVMRELVTECTDPNIYSGLRGRLFRQAAVQRSNGAYKVPLGWGEWQGLTSDSYRAICSEPRPHVEAASGVYASAAGKAWINAFRRVVQPTAPARAKAKTSALKLDSRGGLLTTDRTRIEQALKKLSGVDLEYNNWIKVGAALKSTGASDALDLWEEFSRGYPGYRRGECASRWAKLGGGIRPVGLGTLYALAAKGGAL